MRQAWTPRFPCLPSHAQHTALPVSRPWDTTRPRRRTHAYHALRPPPLWLEPARGTPTPQPSLHLHEHDIGHRLTTGGHDQHGAASLAATVAHHRTVTRARARAWFINTTHTAWEPPFRHFPFLPTGTPTLATRSSATSSPVPLLRSPSFGLSMPGFTHSAAVGQPHTHGLSAPCPAALPLLRPGHPLVSPPFVGACHKPRARACVRTSPRFRLHLVAMTSVSLPCSTQRSSGGNRRAPGRLDPSLPAKEHSRPISKLARPRPGTAQPNGVG